MARHEIPTHLEVEDKLLGPLTSRDALVALVGASAAYGLATSPALPEGIRLGLAAAVALVALTFALVKVRGRPLEGWLFAGLVYLGLARRAVWTAPTSAESKTKRTPDRRRTSYPLRVRWHARPPSPRRQTASRRPEGGRR
jgi:hypothetical protein